MSTRGVIAKTTKDGFEGVYNHSDSYPRWLGRNLWEALHEGQEPRIFVEEWIEAHPGGWADFPEACYCHDSPQDEPEMIVSQDTVDWLFTAWAYAIDPERRTFSVIVGCVLRPGKRVKSHANGQSREFESYGSQLVGTFSLDGDEPPWELVEEQGSRVREAPWAEIEQVAIA